MLIQLQQKLDHDCFMHAERVDQAARTFDMKATTFGTINSYFSAIAPSAFDKHYATFLRDGYIGGLNHDADHPIGAPIKAASDGLNLLVTGELVPGDLNADRLLNLMATQLSTGRPVVKYVSVGGRIKALNSLGSEEEVQKWWNSIGYLPTPMDLQRLERGLALFDSIEIITESELWEVSPVMRPSNPQAAILEVRHQEVVEARRLAEAQQAPQVPAAIDLNMERQRLVLAARRLGVPV